MLTGNGSVDLCMSSTAPDTDLEVMVSELRHDGAGAWQEEYVSKGWLRATTARSTRRSRRRCAPTRRTRRSTPSRSCRER